MKKIAAVNDISGFGKCSLAAAIPVISALGVQCCPLVTGVFSNQTGYDSFYCKDCTEDMEPCAREWEKLDAHFDGILTGFIANSKQGEIISNIIDTFKKDKTVVTVDPIMGDDGKIYPCYNEESVRAIARLTEKADIITPNLTELCLLSGKEYFDAAHLEKNELLKKIEEMSVLVSKTGPKIIVTSGIHFGDGKIANTVYENGNIDVVVSPHYGGSFSGTGDILASFVTAQYVKGVPVKKATRQAADFISKSIEETIKETGGKYNRLDGINFEAFLSFLGQI